MTEDTKCAHINWAMRDGDNIGFGYCFDCKKQIQVGILFDNLRVRMITALDELLEARKQAGDRADVK